MDPEALDARRKDLIKLAVVQLSRLGAGSGTHGLTISRLKQELATRDRLHEAKVDLLQAEIRQLKAAAAAAAASASAPAPRPGAAPPALSFSTSPYLKLNRHLPSLLRLIASVPSPDNSILLPIQPKRRAAQPVKPKRAYTNFNTLRRLNNALGITSDDIMSARTLKLNVPGARRAPAPEAKTTTITAAGSTVHTEDEAPTTAATTDDEFASANSTLNTSDVSVSYRRNKLQLARSQSVPARASPNKGLSLEDEEINTTNYYDDLNWTEDRDTPKKSVRGEVKKRRKNVFKID